MAPNAPTGLTAGTYRGLDTGMESGECSARLEARRIPGGCLAVDYEATSEREGLQHAEHTVVTPDGLYVAITEMPGVVFAQTEPGRCASAAPGPYTMEIHASFADGELTWAWHGPRQARHRRRCPRPSAGSRTCSRHPGYLNVIPAWASLMILTTSAAVSAIWTRPSSSA